MAQGEGLFLEEVKDQVVKVVQERSLTMKQRHDIRMVRFSITLGYVETAARICLYLYFQIVVAFR